MTTGTQDTRNASWRLDHSAAGDSFVHRRDPRLRILLGVGFALVVVSLHRLPLLLLGLGLALGLALAARLPPATTLKRILAMDALMVLVLLLLPFTLPGETLFTLGGLEASREGLLRAVTIALKANAVVIALLALVGTLEAPALGHALDHLRVPQRLIQLLLFTVRYLEVLHREYLRLRLAMQARAFRLRSDLHTWRSVGYLFGMLLVRSLDRSDRVLAAMKCRGFDGRFHRLHHPRAGAADWIAGALGTLLLALLLTLEHSL
ncbi:cobalt ECF transporter T component CbiQ [Thioalbus denitrificans]|uniref:Cobalt/nickel transport system permease protein n=1 Tax=Thioalbus denitrificans TaxID=547122 RepID=A0A369BY32_9GAMM|nr:cobalt ECF transporter T component CbiQ [Thioalbus denitrificans]RCX26539.1 cobalt/nickel transport system permease protein [Thioalbus denitrificans]